MNYKILKIELLIISAILIQNCLNAQVYVSPNTSVYVNNQVVYLANELELNASTSNFYLRKEAQLLQGTAGTGANKGLGNLSTFQEGTVNNYAYNYWCSPVGGNVAAAGNSLFGVTQLGVPTTTTATSPATILASNLFDGVSGTGALSISSRWIYKFLSKNAYADWIYAGSTSNIAAGEGFTMKGTSGSDATVVDGVVNNSGSNQRYDFRGKPNDGTINISVSNTMFTLTGNPYPSAIDLSAFLFDAVNTDGIAYFWESDKTVNSHRIADYIGGYGTFSPVSRGGTGIYVSAAFSTFDGSGNYVGPVGGTPPPPGLGPERRFCPVGQGFMIKGIANGTVQMKNSYRVFVQEGAANHSQFEKTNPNKNKVANKSNFIPVIPSVSGFDYTTVSSLPIPQIRFKTIMNDKLILPMVLVFDPSATDAADFAMDAKSSNEDLDQEIYFGIKDIPYIIDVIAFDVNKKIPIGIRNTAEATYKIAIDTILNFSETDCIYIHDKDNDTYQNLKNSDYTVKMPAGNNTSRFEITFTNLTLKNSSNNLISNIEVLQNNNSHNLTITNPKEIDLNVVNVYDISGRLILNKSKLVSKPQYVFSTSGWSDGVYLVKLTTADNQTMDKKIIVKN